MPDVWMPGARVDGRSWTRYAMNGAGGSVRAGLHTTENGQSSTCKGVADYMWNNAGAGTGYSLLYHPTTGDILQLRPFDVGAGSLKNLSGGVETNKNGKFNFQVSVVAYASEDWATRYPCPRWPEIVAWLRSWGVPDRYVSGPFVSGRATMSTGTWTGSGHGWYGHQHVPENDHSDPGPRPDPWTIGSPGGPTTPPTQPVPPDQSAVLPVDGGGSVTVRVLRSGHSGRDVRQVQALLSEWAISPGKHDGQFGPATDGAVRTFQGSRGLAADGIVGERTWGSLLGY